MPLNMQQNGSPIARNVLLVVLIVASLALATVYARKGQGGPLQGAGQAAGQAGSYLSQ